MILEKRQRSPLFPDSDLGLFMQGNPGTTAIGRTFDCAVHAVQPMLLRERGYPIVIIDDLWDTPFFLSNIHRLT
ncbi:hypothetical protein GCM10010916_06950 [Paenibacillus abyssi]|uniref:Uncharacterized protein n=1 Tax=Paenibacillus abyssi TaxID=1340531 RepID=A0A917CMK0_9BACL|nr:hypothetical protein GCM10010916_06950 [Paenibacillus abyssi]